MNRTFAVLRERAEQVEQEVYALYLAYRDPRTPWYAKAWTALVVAYALSPIDLIPDFVPVLGYLDDILLVPLGVMVALKLIPTEVMHEARTRIRQSAARGELHSRLGAAIVVMLWLFVLALVAAIVWRWAR